MPSTYKSNKAAILAEMDRVIVLEVERTADEALSLVQEMYREPKTGRLYGANAKKIRALRRYRAGKRKTAPSGLHRASAPGEAPAIDSAALRKGTNRTNAQRLSALHWSVLCGITLQSGRGGPVSQGRSIAEILEFGGVKIAPRPAWRPALEILRARRANLKR